jgi:hypothetical protein
VPLVIAEFLAESEIDDRAIYQQMGASLVAQSDCPVFAAL